MTTDDQWSAPRDCYGCGNTTPMLTDQRGNLTCPICGHAVFAEDAGSADPQPERMTFHVQYEPDGRVYTYEDWPADQFTKMIQRRYEGRGELPHRAWTDKRGEINFDVGGDR